MGKRSNFDRVPRDYYPTPIEAVKPLIDHLGYSFDYIEPCAGDGRLITHIDELTEGMGTCLYSCDIEPRHSSVVECDALKVHFGGYGMVDYCITNPPWDRKILHPLIDHYLNVCPTWLLFDADWMHTKQSAPFMTYCRKVVSVGRVKWIEGSKGVGKDNCCWYLFDPYSDKPTEFHGRIL